MNQAKYFHLDTLKCQICLKRKKCSERISDIVRSLTPTGRTTVGSRDNSKVSSYLYNKLIYVL